MSKETDLKNTDNDIVDEGKNPTVTDVTPEVKPASDEPPTETEGAQAKKVWKTASFLKEHYPDKDVENLDGDGLDELASTNLAGIHDKLKKNSEANAEIISVFTDHPEVAEIIRLIAKGATLVQALPYVLDEDEIKALVPAEGDPDYEGWKKNADGRKQMKAESDAQMKAIQENLNVSQQEIQKFVTENKLSDEEAANFFQVIDDIMDNTSNGKFTIDILTKLYKGVTHDKKVAEAKEVGIIKGRNTAIKEKIAKEEKTAGDGTPAISSTGKTTEKAKPELNPIERSLEDFNTNQNRFTLKH